jgi:hypothetical protein
MENQPVFDDGFQSRSSTSTGPTVAVSFTG